MTPEQFVQYVKGLANSAITSGAQVDPRQLLAAANSVQENIQHYKQRLND
tara:strand:- start:356 stop:505 length:150 start_codon:yes stop_codon:yes gene_type:complete